MLAALGWRAPFALYLAAALLLLAGLLALAVVGLVGFGIFAWRPAIGEISPPAPSTFSPALVARGEVLAGAGYCSTCHTTKGSPPFAGGVPLKFDTLDVSAGRLTDVQRTMSLGLAGLITQFHTPGVVLFMLIVLSLVAALLAGCATTPTPPTPLQATRDACTPLRGLSVPASAIGLLSGAATITSASSIVSKYSVRASNRLGRFVYSS